MGEYIANHMYGCRIYQRLLERCPKHMIQDLISKVIPQAVPKLAKDKHGNYVVQSILENGSVIDKQRIMECIAKSMVEFCKNKISSNVVEKCFKTATIDDTDQDFLD